jgi:hypothetical protein
VEQAFGWAHHQNEHRGGEPDRATGPDTPSERFLQAEAEVVAVPFLFPVTDVLFIWAHEVMRGVKTAPWPRGPIGG